MPKRLIVNADDFGATAGINRAIADCHRAGTLSSASLMVLAPAAEQAAALARQLPELSVGLHWVGDLPGAAVDTEDPAAVDAELRRQLALFEKLLGRPPTHLDSHHHLHMGDALMAIFKAAADRLGIPVRGDGTVRFIGGFYAQWEWRVTELEHVSVAALEGILRTEVGDGWTEISCHPGYLTAELQSVYAAEREAEVRTLTDPRIAQLFAELQIELASYADLSGR
jgi:chitin disaccharide deacetylase